MFRRFPAVLFPLFCMLAVVPVLAPTAVLAQVVFDGVAGPVLKQPVSANVQSIALDASGNIFVLDTTTGDIYKETLTNGVYVQTLFFDAQATGPIINAQPRSGRLRPYTQPGGSGNPNPANIAVDGSGKVYFTEANSTFVSVLDSSGSGVGLSQLPANVRGIAVDGAGTIYACTGTSVIKQTGSGFTWTNTTIVPGLNEPTAIAVDGLGNLYVSDEGAHRVYKETFAGGTYTQSTLTFAIADAVAVDGNGNVYLALGQSGAVLKEALSFGTYSESLLSNNLVDPASIAVDANEHVFVTDNQTHTVNELVNPVNFGAVAVGSPSNAIALPFEIRPGTTVGSISVVTTGITNKDFADAGNSTCAAGFYDGAAMCVVYVTLKPHAPGMRRGAVVVADSAGNALATATLYGMGTGAQLAFSPAGSSRTLNQGLNNATSIATDGAGNVFFTDGRGVYKLVPGQAATAVGTGWFEPTSIAVDGAGNLWVADGGLEEIVQVTPSGQQVSLPFSITVPSLAVDPQGNLYFGLGSGVVYKYTPAGVLSVAGIGRGFVSSIALDSVGNVYAAEEFGDGPVRFMPDGRGGFSEQSLVAACDAFGLAIDAADTVYVSDRCGDGGDVIYEIPHGGLGESHAFMAAPDVQAIAIDSSASVFYSDTNGKLIRSDRGVAPALNFAQTEAGSTSSDSGQVILVYNVGNMPLHFPSIVYPPDFPEHPSAVGTDCGTGALGAGGYCPLIVDFTPISAGGSGTAVIRSEAIRLTSDRLNLPADLQRILVKGTETKRASSLALSASSLTPPIGSGYTITATASGGGAMPTGTVTFYAGNVFLTTGTLDGSGAATITGTLPSGLHTITAMYGGDATYTTSTAAPLKVTVQKMATSVSLVSSANSAVSGTSITFTATVPTTLTGVAPRGKVNFYYAGLLVGQASVVNGAGNTATFTTSSLTMTHTMTATYLGDVNYLPAKDTVGVRETITH